MPSLRTLIYTIFKLIFTQTKITINMIFQRVTRAAFSLCKQMKPSLLRYIFWSPTALSTGYPQALWRALFCPYFTIETVPFLHLIRHHPVDSTHHRVTRLTVCDLNQYTATVLQILTLHIRKRSYEVFGNYNRAGSIFYSFSGNGHG